MTPATKTMPQTNGHAGATAEPRNGHVVIDCKLDKVYYGSFLAVRDSRG